MTTKFSRPFYEYQFKLDNDQHKVALVFGSETDESAKRCVLILGANHWTAAYVARFTQFEFSQ